MRVALIDYRAGNLTSVKKAFAAVGADLYVPGQPSELDGAGAVVVPGVGHFGATETLADEWTRTIRQGIDAGKPLLGICLGMQWLFEGSEEAPERKGLGCLAGYCYRLPRETNGTTVKIPHVGWNALDVRRPDSIVKGVASGAQVYFTHSFAAPMTEIPPVRCTGNRSPPSCSGRVAGAVPPGKVGEVGLTICGASCGWRTARCSPSIIACLDVLTARGQRHQLRGCERRAIPPRSPAVTTRKDRQARHPRHHAALERRQALAT